MNAFLSALATPIAEHEVLVTGISEADQKHFMVQLAFKELQVRQSTIRALRSRAKITKNGDWLVIETYLTTCKAEYDRLSKLRDRASVVSRDFLGASKPDNVEMVFVFDLARRIEATWSDLPFC